MPQNDDNMRPGVFYFYSESIGLAANGICALFAALANFEVTHQISAMGINSRAYCFLLVGGILQFLCSLRALRTHDHFGCTSFAIFSIIWWFLGSELLWDFKLSPWSFLSLFLVNTVMAIAAFFVNAYSLLLMLALCIVFGLETFNRFMYSDDNDKDIQDSQDVALAMGVFQLAVLVVTTYGCFAAVLRGVYERQVLPGFDNPIIQTTLWKRKPNEHVYSAGKWANPRPLVNLSLALGLVGVGKSLYRNIYGDEDFDISHDTSQTFWFASIAVLVWISSFAFALRHEIINMVMSMIDASLFAVLAYDSAYPVFGAVDELDGLYLLSLTTIRKGGGVLLCFALVRSVIFLTTIVLRKKGSPTVLFTSLESTTYFIISLGLMLTTVSTSRVAIIIPMVLFFVTAGLEYYNALAELINSITQKQIFIVSWKWREMNCLDTELTTRKITGRTVTIDGKDIVDEEMGLTQHTQSTDSTSSSLDQDTTSVDESLSNNDSDDMSQSTNSSVSKASNFIPPGDENLLGQTDFPSAIYIMVSSLSLFAMMSSIGLIVRLFSSTDEIDMKFIALSSLAKNVIQASAVIISISRGQTSLGFCSFLFLLSDGLMLITLPIDSPSTDMIDHFDSGIPIIASAIVLQGAWLCTSFNLFRPLSFLVIFHIVGRLSEMLSITLSEKLSQKEIKCILSIGTMSYLLMAIISFWTITILLGCYGKISYFLEYYIKYWQKEGDVRNLSRCPIGYAENRIDFEECVKIIRSGGVVVIPTDTVYCLACAADNPEGIERIYQIKDRPSEKPLSLWLGSIEDIKQVGPEGKGWSERLFRFMGEIWPGSVSLVVSRGSWLNKLGVGTSADLIGTHDSIALRLPNSTLTVALIQDTGPLAITSANPSGAADCTHHMKVDDVIASKIDYILGAGASPMSIASSVIDVRDLDAEKIFFYRVGCVPEKFIWEKVRQVSKRSQIHAASFPASKKSKVISMMNLLIEMIGCESWQIHYVQQNPKTQQYSVAMTWESACNSTQRVTASFKAGLSFYTDQNEIINEKSRNEMIIPISALTVDDTVCAVVHLVNKRQDEDSLSPFYKHDLNMAQSVCSQLAQLIDIHEAVDDIDSSILTITDISCQNRKIVIDDDHTSPVTDKSPSY